MDKKQKFIKKIRKTGTSLGINLPSEIVELLLLKEGNLVEIEIKKIK